MSTPGPGRTRVFPGGRADDRDERLMHPASGLFLLRSLPENGVEARTKLRSDRTTRPRPAAARASTAPRPFGTNCLAPPARAVACSSQRKGPRLRHRQTLPRSAIRSEQRGRPGAGSVWSETIWVLLGTRHTYVQTPSVGVPIVSGGDSLEATAAYPVTAPIAHRRAAL